MLAARKDAAPAVEEPLLPVADGLELLPPDVPVTVTTVTNGAEKDASAVVADDDEEVALVREGTAPEEPPAAVDNWANPTEGGLERNTVYTFFKKVSPIIQLGLPPPPPAFDPRLRSNMPPTHCSPLPIVPSLAVPKFMSATLIGQELPPNESETCTSVSQGKP